MRQREQRAAALHAAHLLLVFFLMKQYRIVCIVHWHWAFVL
jgi:hypothetical protein